MFHPLLLPFLFIVVDGLPNIPISSLKECPNIPPQEDLLIEQIAGSWRLAYLFYDENDDLEGDDTCLVGEFIPVGEKEMKIVVFVDVRGDEFIFDRSSLDLSATLQSPGKWMLHSALSETSYVHVTVISLTKQHMILTFCITNVTNHEDNSKDSYSHMLKELRNDRSSSFMSKKVGKHESDLESLNGELLELFGPERYFRKKRSYKDLGMINQTSRLQIFHDKSLQGLKSSKDTKKEKHFWTIVLLKNNNNSPLTFLENASLLMKFGFDLREGNLISFGKCGV